MILDKKVSKIVGVVSRITGIRVLQSTCDMKIGDNSSLKLPKIDQVIMQGHIYFSRVSDREGFKFCGLMNEQVLGES